MTDRCKTITFPQLRLRAVNILNFQFVRQQNPIATDERTRVKIFTGTQANKRIVSTELNSEYAKAEHLSSAVRTLTAAEWRESGCRSPGYAHVSHAKLLSTKFTKHQSHWTSLSPLLQTLRQEQANFGRHYSILLLIHKSATCNLKGQSLKTSGNEKCFPIFWGWGILL